MVILKFFYRRKQLEEIKYEFTNEWFLGNVYGRGLEINVVKIWDTLFRQFNISKILEIGSYEGQSTIHFCEYFCPDKEIEITCVDTWGGLLSM